MDTTVIHLYDISAMSMDDLRDRRISLIGTGECFMCRSSATCVVPIKSKPFQFIALPSCNQCYHIVVYISQLFDDCVMLQRKIQIRIRRTDGTCENDWFATCIKVYDDNIKIQCEKYVGECTIIKNISILEFRAFNPNAKINIRNVPSDLLAEIKHIVSSQGIFFEEYFHK